MTCTCSSEPQPFDLERAKAGEPIQFRDGRPARFLMFDDKLSPSYQLLVANNYGKVQVLHKDGRYSQLRNNDNDIVMAPRPPRVEKHTVYLYKDNLGNPSVSLKQLWGGLSSAEVEFTICDCQRAK